MTLHNSILLLSILLLHCLSLWGQQTNGFKIPDSLIQKTYEELTEGIYEEISNPDIAKTYAFSYLKKAKNENNALNIAKGFNYLSYIYKDKTRLDYLDSIIEYTKNLNLKKYPANAYRNKAIHYYKIRNFKRALDNYLKADFYADKNSDYELSLEVNFNIGLIKSRLGYYDDALNIFKKCSKYYSEDSDHYNYLISIYAIADSYRHLKILDSASFYNKKGIRELKEKKLLEKEDSQNLYNYFILNEGVNQYEKKNYKKALSDISRTIPYIEAIPDVPNSAMGYHFLGKIYMQLGDGKKAEFYLKKVDTIFLKTFDIHPELREGYEILINKYRSEGNKEQQLLYIERLLKIDSILKSNYEYLSRKLVKEYDTPKLINEREQIIDQLKNKNAYRFYWIITLTILLLISGLLFYYYYERQKIIREKFEQYINAQPQQKTRPKKNKILAISQDIQNAILKGLEKFELEKDYLKNETSLHSLAKKLHTNANYLSKIVNFHKEKSFGNYISELRIEYTIERLKTDSIFRKYSIKAISEEVGFNNTESFAKAFYKKTGLKPSHFVKQLTKGNKIK